MKNKQKTIKIIGSAAIQKLLHITLETKVYFRFSLKDKIPM